MKRKMLSAVISLGCLLSLPLQAIEKTASQFNDLTVNDYQRAEKALSKHTTPLVYGTVDSPTWLANDILFYRTQTSAGHSFVLFDAKTGEKRPAFDHQKLASATSSLLKRDYSANSLPFKSATFDTKNQSISFKANDTQVSCRLSNYVCEKTTNVNTNESISPDGKKAVFIKENNLWVRNTKTNQVSQLTFDGKLDFGWGTNNAGWVKRESPVLLWSPDSRQIKTFQHDGREVGEMYLVSTNVGHPKLSAWKYPLPGDKKIFEIHRAVIDVNEGIVTKLNMKPDAHRSSTTDHIAGRMGKFGNLIDAEWSDDGQSIAFLSSSRDHKVATLRVANTKTGEVRDILTERSDTYFESGFNNPNWHYLPESNEVIWFSERSNWGHLYLVDIDTGKVKNAITQGDWAVLEVLKVDKEAREIYFTAGGKEKGDPYFHHLYKVNFNGTGLTLLTPEYAHHSVTFSPSGNYYLDKFSTPNKPGKAQVKHAYNKKSVTIETTDISALVKTNWRAPVPFQVKARDGKTDIFGLLYKPSNFDPNKKYPVVNYLYPGPQSGSVGSRRFMPSRRDKQAMAELGLILIELDAMGTPGRSKSFHDFYYGNMGDNGIPDQIAAIKQLGKKHQWIDLNKVGIWGHSGGGFASTRAMFDYPKFYSVAVSGAGNHDNRNYEDDWGEKWQGLLTENKDGKTNYDNQANQLQAHKLEGKLLLAHGTADSNVPPYNTLLVVDALIAANKDFDLLMLPNRGHGFANEPYMMRKRWDYFVEHLLKLSYPKEYKLGQLK